MSWSTAAARGLAVFVYFAVATVWLPNRILLLGFIETAPSLIRDLVVLLVWGAFLVGGMAMLRIGQRRGLI